MLSILALTTLLLLPPAAAREVEESGEAGPAYYHLYAREESRPCGTGAGQLVPCPSLAVFAGAWLETNGRPGVQRAPTCADGSFAGRDGCADGSEPTPPDTTVANEWHACGTRPGDRPCIPTLE